MVTVPKVTGFCTAATSGPQSTLIQWVLTGAGSPLCSHLTVREISHETDLLRSCVHDIAKKDLNLKCLKRKAAQELTEANKVARYERSKQLLRKYPEHTVDFIWDEKLFAIARPRNSQNDRLYVHSAVKKRDVAGRRLLSTRPTFSRSVMVSVAVSTLGCTDIHFLEPGVKVNGEYYRNAILCNMLLPDIWCIRWLVHFPAG